MSTERRHQALKTRLEIIRDRKAKRGDSRCDLCRHNAGSEWHHIITKHSTMGNERAREAANSPKLAAWLCPDCHRVADSPESRNKLFQELYRIYGFEAVISAYYGVKVYMTYGLLFFPPDPEK